MSVNEIIVVRTGGIEKAIAPQDAKNLGKIQIFLAQKVNNLKRYRSTSKSN